MRIFVTSAVSMVLVLAVVDLGQTQDRNDRRRQFFEGILRTLVESQIDREPGPDNRPPNPNAGRNPQLQAARQTLERFSDESGRLLTALRREEQVNPAYRSVLGDVVRIKAGADVMMQRGGLITAEQFSNDYLAIDRQWRVVSHRLRQIPGFDRDCLAHVEKMNVYDQQICELLSLAPQLDRLELTRQVAEMNGFFQALIDDLAYDVRRQPTGQALLLEAQKLQARVVHLGQVIAQGGAHQVVVAEYQQFYARWRQLATAVRSTDDRYIARSVRRIEAANDAIHELLWLPKSVDRGELLALVKTLQHDFEHVNQGITLQQLLVHPNPQETLAGMLAFDGLCANLVKSLAGQTSLEELVWDFRMLEVEWQTAASRLAGWREPELDQTLAVVQRTMEILSQTLGQELTIDHREVVALVASLHENADALAAQTARLLNSSNQYPPGFHVSAGTSANKFRDAAHHLHESLARHASDDHLKRDSLELVAAWQSMQQSLAEFSPQHRSFLNQICQPLAPQIAKVQVLFAY